MAADRSESAPSAGAHGPGTEDRNGGGGRAQTETIEGRNHLILVYALAAFVAGAGVLINAGNDAVHFVGELVTWSGGLLLLGWLAGGSGRGSADPVPGVPCPHHRLDLQGRPARGILSG
jgi:hypothetical protein